MNISCSDLFSFTLPLEDTVLLVSRPPSFSRIDASEINRYWLSPEFILDILGTIRGLNSKTAPLANLSAAPPLIFQFEGFLNGARL